MCNQFISIEIKSDHMKQVYNRDDQTLFVRCRSLLVIGLIAFQNAMRLSFYLSFLLFLLKFSVSNLQISNQSSQTWMNQPSCFLSKILDLDQALYTRSLPKISDHLFSPRSSRSSCLNLNDLLLFRHTRTTSLDIT